MKRFLHSIDLAIGAHDWYGALSTALTLPDICGRIEAPDQGSKLRYIDWFNRYLLHQYSATVGANGNIHVFLHGEDCYALRCSYLHEGGGTIVEQRARRALDSFHFITPPVNGNLVHMNQNGNVLQLQVDIFCQDMCTAVDRWLTGVVIGNAELEGRLRSLLEIRDSSKGILF